MLFFGGMLSFRVFGLVVLGFFFVAFWKFWKIYFFWLWVSRSGELGGAGGEVSFSFGFLRDSVLSCVCFVFFVVSESRGIADSF